MVRMRKKKLNMKLLNREILLVAVCILMISGSVYSLYRELTGRITKSSADAIGTIVFKKKNAERKYAEFVIWEDIAGNSPVFNYDSIRTFRDSAAYIHLKNGAEISLDEDTMIVLVADEKGVKISFDKGTVSAKNTASGAANISFNTKDVSISVNKGELALKKTENDLDINVSSGDALVDSGKGEVKKIESNVNAHITNGKTEVRKIRVIPELPADSTFFITYRTADTVEFKWKSEVKGDDTVQVAKDAGFRVIVQSAAGNNNHAAVQLPAGDYYWRVVSGGEISPVKKFTLIKDSVTEYVYPSADELTAVTGDEEPVNFKWSGSLYASGYDLELAQDRDMIKSLKKIHVKINSASVAGLPAGYLWWKVNRIYPESFKVLDNSKRVIPFRLERRTVTRVKPKPLHDREMKSTTFNENIIFSWEGGKGVKNYKVDLSKESDFKNIIRSQAITTAFYNAGKIPEGSYYWRVSADYGYGEPMVSDTVHLTVSPPVPVTYIFPGNGSVLDSASGQVKFTWQDLSEAGNYLFELSPDPEFKNRIVSVRIDVKNFTVKNPGNGKYYWRVSIIDRNGSYIAKGGNSLFVIHEILARPVALYPPSPGVINLDDTDVIKFQWERVEGAESYEIQVYQRISGTDRPLFVKDTEGTKYEFRNFAVLNPGTIVWVVKARKTVNGKITATSESPRNYFVLKVNENITAPKYSAPDTIYVK
jgi:hypothetical protein